MDLTFIAAAPFELEPLQGLLAGGRHQARFHVCGIGALTAAKGARDTAEASRGRHAIFVGSCGTFGPFKAPALVRIEEVLWMPTGERLGLGYTVGDSGPPIRLPKPAAWAASLPPKTAICSPTVSLKGGLPGGLRRASCVENLELYSVAGELVEAARSVNVVLTMTNRVDRNAHAQWKSNFNAAAIMAADFIASSFA